MYAEEGPKQVYHAIENYNLEQIMGDAHKRIQVVQGSGTHSTKLPSSCMISWTVPSGELRVWFCSSRHICSGKMITVDTALVI